MLPWITRSQFVSRPVHGEADYEMWVSHEVLALPGVTIGNGAVVGAGAVVTEDVAPYTAVAGVSVESVCRPYRGHRVVALRARDSG